MLCFLLDTPIRVNVKKNLDKEANTSHRKRAQKVQDRRYGEVRQESGVPALPGRSTATNLRQGSQKTPVIASAKM